ncbi:hypothetical protein NPIL_361601, partial [Nephila pilipes]
KLHQMENFYSQVRKSRQSFHFITSPTVLNPTQALFSYLTARSKTRLQEASNHMRSSAQTRVMGILGTEKVRKLAV